jgi:hypothetical protein
MNMETPCERRAKGVSLLLKISACSKRRETETLSVAVLQENSCLLIEQDLPLLVVSGLKLGCPLILKNVKEI